MAYLGRPRGGAWKAGLGARQTKPASGAHIAWLLRLPTSANTRYGQRTKRVVGGSVRRCRFYGIALDADGGAMLPRLGLGPR